MTDHDQVFFFELCGYALTSNSPDYLHITVTFVRQRKLSTMSTSSSSSSSTSSSCVEVTAGRASSSQVTTLAVQASTASSSEVTTLAVAGQQPQSAPQKLMTAIAKKDRKEFQGIHRYRCTVKVFDGEKTLKSKFSGFKLPIETETFRLSAVEESRSRSPSDRVPVWERFKGTPFESCTPEQLRSWKIEFGDGSVRTSLGWKYDEAAREREEAARARDLD